tara:strand:+ start:294 stop:395 length:102 start_codon:yes stop_codon:yes gene_type:complete
MKIVELIFSLLILKLNKKKGRKLLGYRSEKMLP